jgi:hypothetical protein
MAERYLGVVGIGEALGVTRHAVHKWRSRHPPGSDHPFPEPDVEIDGAPGWRPDRLEEVMQWRSGLPGRGAGGGRPSASEQEYLREAFARGLNEHEALTLLDSMEEERPEMTRAESAVWLLGRWRD